MCPIPSILQIPPLPPGSVPSIPTRTVAGILPITDVEYFDLVDQSGRILRSDKRGAIDADLAPILQRIGANPQAWVDTISRFESRFRLAAGLISSLRGFADQLGRRWLAGVSAARIAFVAKPQSA